MHKSSDAPNVKTRIGIHCGKILLGHIGALDHYEYPIRGMRWNRIGASGSGIVGYLRRKLMGYPLKSIADYFRRHPVSLCQGIPKVEKRLREEHGFREKLVGLGYILGRTEKPQIQKAEECILQGIKILDELKLKP